MRERNTALLALALAATAVAPVRGEIGLGLAGGAIWPGGQDVTLQKDGAAGEPSARVLDRDAFGSPSEFVALGVTGWTAGRRAVGVRLEAMSWKSRFELVEASELAGRGSIEESFRTGFLFLLGRVPLDRRGSFLFAGLGAGLAYESIEGVPRNHARAFGALAGAAVPIAARLRAQLQISYLVCSDSQVDSMDGALLETSGSPSGRSVRAIFGPHLDKRFLPVTVGLELRL